MHALNLQNTLTHQSSCGFAQRRCIQSLVVIGLILLGGQVRAATFKVDDTSLTVPGILGDDWRSVQHRKTWTKADGKSLGDDSRFVRFLARDYSFQSSDSGLRMKTSWFVHGKCISTNERVSSLSSPKRRSIESAVGSLREMGLRLKEAPDDAESRIVIWAQFKSSHDISVPLESLSGDDLRTLSPFAELARQAFETRLSRTAQCKDSETIEKSRDSARSSGRRMRPSKSQSKKTLPKRSAPRPTGRLVAGAVPSAGKAAERPDRRVDERSRKQEWAILIEKFVAKPGSLVFEPASQFTRCILAYTEAEALAAATAAYRSRSGKGNGQRVSYTVFFGGGECGESSGGSGGESSADSESFDSSTDSGPAGEDFTGGNEEDDSLEPTADPLDIDSEYGGESGGGEGEFDEYDFESIPASEDYGDGEMSDFEPASELSE